MANVPNELVLRSIEDIVQGHCKISDTQTCPKMSPSAADIVDHILSQLLAQLFELPPVEVLDVDRVVDGVQERRERFVVSGGVERIQFVYRDLVKGLIAIAGAVVTNRTIDRGLDGFNSQRPVRVCAWSCPLAEVPDNLPRAKSLV